MNPFKPLLEAIDRLFRSIASWFEGPRKTPAQPPKPVEPSRGPKKTDPAEPIPTPAVEPPWLSLARKEDGVAEKPGKAHNPKILQYFADAGFPQIKDDETAWCAAFANAMLERAGYAGSKSLAARSFLSWGKKLEKPRPGCIAVFWRVSPKSWQGHVGFYVGEDATHIFVLGGNQSNRVNVTRYSKKQFLGYRWPTTMKNSRTVTASVVGSVSAATAGVSHVTPEILTAVADAGLPIASELKSLAFYFQIFGLIGSLIAIASFGLVLYARIDDLRKKGR